MIKKTVKTNQSSSFSAEHEPDVPFQEVPPQREVGAWREKLARNLALSGMILLCVVSLRNAQLPSGQTVLTAVQEVLEPPLDETLGKISFVSALFPDTVSVFLDASPLLPLTAPCFGEISHPWKSSEPYVGYSGGDGRIYAAAQGEVMSLAHGMNEEIVLRVQHENGVETLYYNLDEAFVREGDAVDLDTCLGSVIAGQEALLEVRRAGHAVDPSAVLSSRSAQP